MAGLLSKGIKLFLDEQELLDLQEIPDLGGEAESVEVTTLADEAHMYINGILNYGDSLAFKFLYVKEQFATLNALEGDQNWKVELPDGATCTFKGACSVKLDGAGVNAALTYTLSVKPSTAMAWA
jgi:hypothetical protein